MSAAGRDGDTRRKVAILGAGPAGLAAAFALSRTEELRARFAVTVYQMGWRAGGKSATGRAMDQGWRIEQNGSHYLFGCYGNSFEMVREAYEVLEQHGVDGFGEYRTSFVPRTLIVATEDAGAGKWVPWAAFLPESPAWPDRGGKYPPPSHFVFVGLQLLLAFVLGLFIDTKDRARSASVVSRLFPLSPFHDTRWARAARALALAAAWVIDGPLWLAARALHGLGRVLFWLLPGLVQAAARRAAFQVAGGACRAVRALARCLDPIRWCGQRARGWGPIARVHRLRVMVELGATLLLGVLRDRLWEAGRHEAIDGLDFREWLRKHGASNGPDGAVSSALVKVWYDAVVAYEDGEPHKPRISAPVTVHALFRALATYKGAFAYQMTHEIGDCFIAPIVRALQLRGVRFEFFHRVRDVVPGEGEDANLVQEIVVDEQIPEERRRKHRLFVTMDPALGPGGNASGPADSRKVWPNRPVFEDEEPGGLPPGGGGDVPEPPLDSYYSQESVERRRLVRGVDFHDVVFALPSGVVDDFAGLRDRPGWAEMRRHLKSTASQSMRLWLTKPLAELGWTGLEPILSGFAYPFSTWEDNSQNCGSELFGGPQPPQAIATFFGPLRTGAVRGTGTAPLFEHTAHERAGAEALRFYVDHVPAIWRALQASPGAKFEVLVAAPDARGQDRFKAQYCRANVGPLEEYVLALPGTLQHRLRPDESGFRNMSVAGEWTRNGFEVGCVEGAIISGLAAAQALSRQRGNIMGKDDITFGLFRSTGTRLSRPRRRSATGRVSVA